MQPPRHVVDEGPDHEGHFQYSIRDAAAAGGIPDLLRPVAFQYSIRDAAYALAAAIVASLAAFNTLLEMPAIPLSMPRTSARHFQYSIRDATHCGRDAKYGINMLSILY